MTNGKVVTALILMLPEESCTRPFLNMFLAFAPKSTPVPWRRAGGQAG